MLISKTSIDNLKNQIDIVDIISSFIELKKSGVNRRDVLKSFKIWAYLEYNDEGDEVDNSENALTEEVEYIVNYLARFPTLGLTDSSLQGCMPMQIEEMEIVNYGEILANVAFCSIDVVMFKSVT